MKPWQVILIILIYDIAKSLCIEFLKWKDWYVNESSSSSTTSETNNTVDKAVDIPDKATNEDLMEQESTTKDDMEDIVKKVFKAYKESPSATNYLDIPHEYLYSTQMLQRCKYCEHWKDSDGKYRRGCGAESKCPINNDIVYRGEGYCYMFSPKVDYNKEIE